MPFLTFVEGILAQIVNAGNAINKAY